MKSQRDFVCLLELSGNAQRWTTINKQKYAEFFTPSAEKVN